jgi:hypothetical protein
MRGNRHCKTLRIISLASLIGLTASMATAATLDVPTTYSNIAAAVAAAADGDEIRVQSGHVDESAWVDLTGKSVTIRSYNNDFTAPETGASWFGFTDTLENQGYAVRLENSTLTIEGFGFLSCLDCSMIVVGSNSTLNVEDCYFEGTSQVNTSAIDTGPMGESSTPAVPVTDIAINVNNSTFNANGRAIWTRSHEGTSEFNITNTMFSLNSSWAVEFRTGSGNHTLNFSDSVLQTNANRTMRLYAFGNMDPAEITNYNVNIDSVLFDLDFSARAAMIMGGVESAAHPDSSWTLNAVNSIFDLRDAEVNAETSAIIALTDATRRGDATLDHCTILTGDPVHSAMRLRGGPDSLYTLRNSIVDGPGTALKNEGSGTLVSGVNLINTDTVSDGSLGTILSGNEIVGEDPLFVDRANGNFALATGSPAISVGEELGVSDDFEGSARPQPVASLPDLGALESPEGEVQIQFHVPDIYATIADAVAAAGDGDEIKVRNDHTDGSHSIDHTGSTLSIRSYNSDYTVPTPGASWVASTGTGNGDGHVILVENGSLTIEGFAALTCSDGSVLVAGNNSTLNIENCAFTGTAQADTAAVDTRGVASAPGLSQNVTININNSTLDGNGRAVWTRDISGTNVVTITNSTISSNSSWAIEFRALDGDHTLNFADSVLQTSANRTMRLYAFGNTDPTKITDYNVNIDRVYFDLSGAARAATIMGGVDDAAHPDSSWNLIARNCVFDLRNAEANAETSAVVALTDTTRRGDATLQHCTIVTGDPLHSGVRLRGGPESTYTLENCIVDGPGTALKNEGTGTVVSQVNLFNTTDVTDGSPGTTLSGSEITGVSPQFVDRVNGDFALAPASPAIGVGVNLGFTSDIAGNPRPNPGGSNPDLGAYESDQGVVLDELFVPAVYATIADAVAAAEDGEEIRVASNHQDPSNTVTLSGKSLTIRSYNTAYAEPETGARWVTSTGTGTNEGYAIHLDNATLTIDGFEQLTCTDGSMIVVGASSTLNAENCVFTGTGQTETAPIDTLGNLSLPGTSSNISINLLDSSISGNGRAIYTRSITGINELNILSSVISGNSTWAIEFRVLDGDHTMNFIDSTLASAVNGTMRLYAFGNTDPLLITKYHVNAQRSNFVLTSGARTPFVVGGVREAAHPDSSWTLEATNCVMDLRSALANLETSAILSLTNLDLIASATLRHCTVLTGNELHAGMRLRGHPDSVFTMENSIVDGPGTAFKNEGTGTIVSGVNLLNTPTLTFGDGTITFSGNEIVGASPEFLDRDGADFRLASTSPALEVGVDLGVTVDKNGDPRPNPVGSNPDLGAFEMPGDTPIILGDINGDGVINVADVTELAFLVGEGTPPSIAVGDMNGDETVDEADIAALADMIVNN